MDARSYKDLFPEWGMDGDPFIATLILFDEFIDDRLYNYEWLGLTAIEAEREAVRFERELTSYGILTLARWYGLSGPQPIDPILAAGGWSS